jgi:hypothetical protein
MADDVTCNRRYTRAQPAAAMCDMFLNCSASTHNVALNQQDALLLVVNIYSNLQTIQETGPCILIKKSLFIQFF